MKKSFSLFIILIGLVFTFSNCRKETEATIVHRMEAKVDGISITCDSSVSVTMDVNGKLYGIQGSQSSGNAINITFPASYGVGTFHFLSFYNGTMCEAFYTKHFDFNHQYHSSDGEITVTSKKDKNIKGTFHFTGLTYQSTDSVKITEGTFDIDY